MTRSVALCLAILCFPVATVRGQPVAFTAKPPGYAAGQIPLGPGNSASALAPDPDDENFLYAAGDFEGAKRIVRIDLRDASRRTVFTCPTTPVVYLVHGFAVLTSSAIFASDNWNDHLYRLRDENADGDFDDPGELSNLIDPILADPTWGWTGSAVQIVRSANNSLGLPAGTVLLQSEDGMSSGEILAVIDPLTSPSYQPPGQAYFTGLDYGGGMAIDSSGRMLVASSNYPNVGAVWVCEDTSGNGVIEAGESNRIVGRASPTTESAGVSSLTIDNAGRCYVAVGWGGFFAGIPGHTDIRAFSVPADPLNTTATVSTFASLNSPYVNAAIFNTPTKPFLPGTRGGAVFIIAPTDNFLAATNYLLTLKPYHASGTKRWPLYR